MSDVETFTALLSYFLWMNSSLEKAIYYQRTIFLLHLFLGAHFRYNIINVQCSLERFLPIAFSLFLWKTSVTRLPYAIIPQNEVCAFYVENNCYLFLLLQKKCICIPKSTGISTNLPLLSPPKKLCEKISHGKLSFSNSANSAYIDNIWRWILTKRVPKCQLVFTLLPSFC